MKKSAFKLVFAAIAGMMVCFFSDAGTIPAAANAASSGKVSCRVETDRSVFYSGQSQTAVLKVTLEAPAPPMEQNRPRVNLCLVLDRSGSMSGAKIEKTKSAAIEAVRRLGSGDIFSLVVYDSNVQTLIPAGRVRDINQIVRTIERIESGGNTALFGGVSQGAAEIRKYLEGDYVNRIILLSDGLANVGPGLPEDLGRLGAALLKEDISVSTIGVGTDYNEDLMAKLSQKSDGNTYFVESERDLPRIFTAELGDVLNVVAKRVAVKINLEDGVKPVKIIGREGRIRGNTIELFMNQLYGSQEKYGLIEVTLPAAAEGATLQAARATVSYEDPFTRKNESVEGISRISFSKDPGRVEKSANVDVVREYQLNLNALAQEKAIELSDKGKTKEAAQYLKQSVDQLKKIGQKYEDKELLQEAEASEVQADAIEAEGMSKTSRKALRTKAYQMKNQQQTK